MVSADVNILVHAFRDDASEHQACRRWLQATLEVGETLALSNVVLSGFVRIVTHPKIFELPTPLEAALEFVEVLRTAPTVVHRPSSRIANGLAPTATSAASRSSAGEIP